MRKIGTRNLLSAIVVLWGAVMLGMAFVVRPSSFRLGCAKLNSSLQTSWEQLVVCRTLLGLLESGFFPGCVFLIS